MIYINLQYFKNMKCNSCKLIVHENAVVVYILSSLIKGIVPHHRNNFTYPYYPIDSNTYGFHYLKTISTPQVNVYCVCFPFKIVVHICEQPRNIVVPVSYEYSLVNNQFNKSFK